MRVITPISASRTPGRAPAERQPAGDNGHQRQPVQALVVLDRNIDDAALNPRPSALFLAQLIATAQKAPQTRQRRRAEPADAAQRYAAASGHGAVSGRTHRSTI
jgi:hypothetical protein